MPNLKILFPLLLEQTFQVFVVIVFEIFNGASRSLETFLDGEIDRLVPTVK